MKNTEIERKYLIKDMSFLDQAVEKHHIIQGFIARADKRVVRVRLLDNYGFITIKTPLLTKQNKGLAHFEWEKQILLEDAKVLLEQCLPTIIEKYRYIVPLGDLKIEIDVFCGENEGLMMAEIELPSEGYALPALPSFIGLEVTGDKRYYNSYLSENPYKHWQS